MKARYIIALFILGSNAIYELNARDGGAIAGGVLGGLAVGSMIGAASSRPRYYYVRDNGNGDSYAQGRRDAELEARNAALEERVRQLENRNGDVYEYAD